MNVLKEYDADGQLVRERPVGVGEVVDFSVPSDHRWSLEPEPGFQLNGHRVDCRCAACRPDIWRLPGG
jgi:hypothetical protein